MHNTLAISTHKQILNQYLAHFLAQIHHTQISNQFAVQYPDLTNQYPNLDNAILTKYRNNTVTDEGRNELNGHPEDEVKRQRNHGIYANELYSTMWNPNNTPIPNTQQQNTSQNAHDKWGPHPVKEEPKTNIPLPEILENNAANTGSPHVMVCLHQLSLYFGCFLTEKYSKGSQKVAEK